METINIKQLRELIEWTVRMIKKNNFDRTAQDPITVKFLQWNLEMIFKIDLKVNYVDSIGYKLDFYFEGEWYEIFGVHC